MTDHQRPPAENIAALTGLRFVAAFAIVLHHLQGMLWLPAGAFAGIPLNQGVSFFYVLSGFILQHSYRHRLGRSIGPRQFIVLRFFRLWPCHVAVLMLIVIANGSSTVDLFSPTHSTGQILAAVVLLQAWSPDIKVVFALNAPAWSISVELFFYAMFPWFCRQALHAPLRPLYSGAAITGAWLIGIWLYLPNGTFETLAGSNPLARVFEFAVGVSACEFFSRPNRRFPGGTALELAALVLAGFTVATTTQVAAVAGSWLGTHVAWWVGNCGSLWAFVIVILVFSRHAGWVSRFVSWQPVVYLGEVSFALYLVHLPLIVYLAGSAPWFRQLAVPIQAALFIALVLALSSALHHVVEKPSMSFARRLVLRRRRLDVLKRQNAYE